MSYLVKPLTDNQKYVQRGRDMVMVYDPAWEKDLKRENRHKMDAPFQYANAMFMVAVGIREEMNSKFRQLQGMIDGMLGPNHKTPAYNTLWSRINKLYVSKDAAGMITVLDKKSKMSLVIDGSGLKPHSRGERIRKKWKIKRGFVKIHLLADIKTRMIIAVLLTDDSVGDTAALAPLVAWAWT